MYNIFQKQIYIKHYNIIRVSHGKLTSWNKDWQARVTVPHITQCFKFRFILVVFIVCNAHDLLKIQSLNNKTLPFIVTEFYHKESTWHQRLLRKQMQVLSHNKWRDCKRILRHIPVIERSKAEILTKLLLLRGMLNLSSFCYMIQAFLVDYFDFDTTIEAFLSIHPFLGINYKQSTDIPTLLALKLI